MQSSSSSLGAAAWTQEEAVPDAANLYLYDLPDDHYAALPERVGAVDADEVQRVARAHLRPDSRIIVAVGPESEIAAQLASNGAS